MEPKNALPDHNVVIDGNETNVHCYQGSRLVVEGKNRDELGSCPFCEATNLVLAQIPEVRAHDKVLEL